MEVSFFFIKKRQKARNYILRTAMKTGIPERFHNQIYPKEQRSDFPTPLKNDTNESDQSKQ